MSLTDDLSLEPGPPKIPKVLEFRGRLFVCRPTLPADIVDRVAELEKVPRWRRGRRFSDQATDNAVRLVRAAFAWRELSVLTEMIGDDDVAWREVVVKTAFLYERSDLVGGV